jgi:tetratricopeptide (TPR) repeat protein
MSAREVLQSWKEISAYLGRDIRTCCRWEANLGLPVHRLNGSPKARVLAYKDEIDRWLEMKLHEREVIKPNFRSALKRWPVVAVFTAVLVVAVLGWRSLNNGGRPRYLPAGGHPLLAVLPFVNGTGEPGLDYLCESIPDHLIGDLQRDDERMTVFCYEVIAEAVAKLGLEPGKPLTPNDLAALASRTGAGWLLVGYVAKSGSKLRIDYALREAKSQDALKTDHVPGTEVEMPVMEERVADAVRRIFGVPVSSGPRTLLACSVQATRFYETARALDRKYILSPSPENLDKIIWLFDQARQADPGCALAYLGLGDAYQNRFVYEGGGPEALQLMKENYERAYGMDPDRAETNVGMAWVPYFDGDIDRTYAFLKRALELDPNSLHVLADIGAFLASIGVMERSTEYFSRVIRAGGATADMHLLRGKGYEHMGLYESALADLDKVIELEPDDANALCHRARTLILLKKYEAAAADLAMAETLEPENLHIDVVRALLAAARGEKKAALEAIEPVRAAGRPGRYTYYLSRIYAVLGMRNEAIGNIETAIDKGFGDVQNYLYSYPYFNNTRDYFYDTLRGEPRFNELQRREELKYADRLDKYNGL